MRKTIFLSLIGIIGFALQSNAQSTESKIGGNYTVFDESSGAGVCDNVDVRKCKTTWHTNSDGTVTAITYEAYTDPVVSTNDMGENNSSSYFIPTPQYLKNASVEEKTTYFRQYIINSQN
jgi:hypothetical protein